MLGRHALLGLNQYRVFFQHVGQRAGWLAPRIKWPTPTEVGVQPDVALGVPDRARKL